MKTCFKCKEDKEVTAFNKRGEGFSSYCKVCNKKNLQKHYLNNKEYYANKRTKHRKSVREYINKIKDNPCIDCGNTFPTVCMDFDHLKDKSFTIGHYGIEGHSIKRIQEEIDKCELVCSNCHRIRTRDRAL